MEYRFLTMQREGRILTVGLNRPPLNALGVEFGRELFRAFTEAGQMEEVTVVVIRSLLEKAFVAGADIKEMAAMNRAESEAFSKRLKETFSLLPRMRKVVVAAIHGHALGGGCELALACDYRFMAAGKGRIGLPMEEALAVERKYGLENLGSHDAKEGLAAFAERRKPDFRSR